MKHPLLFLLSILAINTSLAQEYSRAIFYDDFSANAFGPPYGHYKSGSIFRDGVLVGITPEGSDHNAVYSVKFDPERDLKFAFKFKFANSQAKSFTVWFDGRDYKGSHAGHIGNVTFNQKSVMVGDAKTGSFRNDLYERKKAQPSALTDEDKKLTRCKKHHVSDKPIDRS